VDSLTPKIRPWSDTSYSWIERQSAQDPLRWVSLAANRDDDTGAILAGRRETN